MTHIKLPLTETRDKQLTELKLRKLKAQTAKIQAKIQAEIIDEVKTKTHRYLSVILAILSVNFFLGDFLDW